MTGIRWQRLVRHFRAGSATKVGHYPMSMPWRLVEAGFLIADLFFVPELLMALNRLFKPNTRRLLPREIALARTVFGESIDYQKVRVDERSYIGCKQYHFAYVGFRFINCWGALSDQHFIHELVHVWQYARDGSVYIPRALWAQRTTAGYNYGGIAALRRVLEQGRGLEAFNYEQQGDIVADYFCLMHGIRPRWCAPDREQLPVFESIIKGFSGDILH